VEVNNKIEVLEKPYVTRVSEFFERHKDLTFGGNIKQ